MKIQIAEDVFVSKSDILNEVFGTREVECEEGRKIIKVLKSVSLLDGSLHLLKEPYDETAREALGYPRDESFSRKRTP
jgi:hypothetical protein